MKAATASEIVTHLQEKNEGGNETDCDGIVSISNASKR